MPVTLRAKESSIATSATETLPIEERIRRRAYDLYVQRGNKFGSEIDDWLQAEEELLQAQEEALHER